MENPEEILHSLEEFAKMKPKDIPRELEEYLKFVAKTGDPIYQWPAIKSLFREKFINVITEFYEACASIEIPPCPNVEMFNYDLMKNFILEKLDTFASAPFTLQRICELLTSPRKEYSRIDKYMRALEKNILVVSTMEPGGRRTENGESIMNGIESDHEHVPEPGNEINVEEMDESPYLQTTNHITERISFDNPKNGTDVEVETSVDTFSSEKISSEPSTSSQEIVCVQYVSIEPIASDDSQNVLEDTKEEDVTVTITAINIKDAQDKSLTIEVEEPPKEVGFTDNISESKQENETEATAQMGCESTEEISKIEVAMETTEVTTSTLPDTPVEESEDDQLKNIPDSKNNLGKEDNESISPESSITSSDSSCESYVDTNVSGGMSSNNMNSEVESNLPPIEPTDIADDEIVMKKISIENLDSDPADSTTGASGDNIVCEVVTKPEHETAEVEISNEKQLEIKSSDESSEVHSTEESVEKNVEAKDSTENEDNSDESILTDMPSDESPKTVEEKEISENEDKDKETIETILEDSNAPGNEETPMEVDIIQENVLDPKNTEEVTPSSEPPEKS